MVAGSLIFAGCVTTPENHAGRGRWRRGLTLIPGCNSLPIVPGPVFICADESSDIYALRLVGWLRQHGLRVADGYGSQLESSSAVVVLMTPSAGRSTEIAGKLGRARALGRPIFGLLVDGEPFVDDFEDVSDGELPGQLLDRLAALHPSAPVREAPAGRGFGWHWLLWAPVVALALLATEGLGRPTAAAAVGQFAERLAVPVSFMILLIGAFRLRRFTFAVVAAIIDAALAVLYRAVGPSVPIDFLAGYRGVLGYYAFYGLVGAVALIALVVALVWYLVRRPRRFTVWSAVVLPLLVAAGVLDFVYWLPYGFGEFDTWPFLLLLVILAQAAVDPDRDVRRMAAFAALATVALRTVWVLTATPRPFIHPEFAAGAAAALAVATMGLALSLRRARRAVRPPGSGPGRPAG
jgi:hypothetical protein